MSYSIFAQVLVFLQIEVVCLDLELVSKCNRGVAELSLQTTQVLAHFIKFD